MQQDTKTSNSVRITLYWLLRHNMIASLVLLEEYPQTDITLKIGSVAGVKQTNDSLATLSLIVELERTVRIYQNCVWTVENHQASAFLGQFHIFHGQISSCGAQSKYPLARHVRLQAQAAQYRQSEK